MHEGMGGPHLFLVHVRTNDSVEPERILKNPVALAAIGHSSGGFLRERERIGCDPAKHGQGGCHPPPIHRRPSKMSDITIVGVRDRPSLSVEKTMWSLCVLEDAYPREQPPPAISSGQFPMETRGGQAGNRS